MRKKTRRKFTKRPRKSFKRGRKTGRKNGKRKMHASVKKQGLFIPDNSIVKLNYCDYKHFTTSGGQYSFMGAYRGNGAHDPLTATGGTSPLGWTQYQQLYNWYRVFAAKMTVTLINQSTAPISFSILPQLFTNSTLRPTDIVAQKYCKTAVCSQSGTAGAKQVLTCFMTTKTLYSNRAVSTEDDFGALTIGTSASVPLNQWYFLIYCTSINGSSAIALDAIIKIKYYIRFEQRRANIGMDVYDDTGINAQPFTPPGNEIPDPHVDIAAE